VHAADLIGQLIDPNRPGKCPALFYEFEQIALNEKLGYRTPRELCDSNAKFYWDVVNPYVQDALLYLCVTQEGKEWSANLNGNMHEGEPRISVKKCGEKLIIQWTSPICLLRSFSKSGNLKGVPQFKGRAKSGPAFNH
jgi:hypothetical protein